MGDFPVPPTLIFPTIITGTGALYDNSGCAKKALRLLCTTFLINGCSGRNTFVQPQRPYQERVKNDSRLTGPALSEQYGRAL